MSPQPREIPASVAWEAAWSLTSSAGRGAIVVAALSAAVALWFLVPFAADAVVPAPRELAKGEDPQKNADQQKVTFDKYVAQVRGRSLFFVPPPPRANEPVEVAKVDESKPPPPPSSYGGPSIVAMLSDTVWFSNGKKLKVGESSDGVKVVELMPPWQSKLEWKGVEFEVGFFERSKVGKPPKDDAATDASKDTAPEAGSENPKADEAKPVDAATTDPKGSQDPPVKDQAATDAAKPGEAKPGDPKPGDAKPGEPPSGEKKPADVKPGEPPKADPKGS